MSGRSITPVWFAKNIIEQADELIDTMKRNNRDLTFEQALNIIKIQNLEYISNSLCDIEERFTEL